MNFIRKKRMIEDKVLHLAYVIVRGSWGGGTNLSKTFKVVYGRFQ